MTTPTLEAWVAALLHQGPEPLDWLRLSLAGFAAAVAVASLVFGLVPPLGHLLAPRPVRERMKDFVPFTRLHADGTLDARGGWSAAVWTLEGTDHTGLAGAERDALFTARANAFFALAENASAKLEIQCVALRRHSAHDDADETRAVASTLPGALQSISKRWDGAHAGATFENRHYIVAYAQGPQARAALAAVNDTLATTLDAYHPRRLAADEGALDVFAALLSPAAHLKPREHGLASEAADKTGRVTGAPQAPSLADLLCCDRLTLMRDGRTRFTHGPHTVWMQQIGVRKLPDQADENVLIELLCADAPLDVIHQVRPLDRLTESAKLMRETHANFASFSASGGGAAHSLLAKDILDGKDLKTGGHLLHHQLLVRVHAPDEETLERNVTLAQRVLHGCGMASVREGLVAESLLWGILPGIEAFVRPWRVFNFTVAAAWAPQNAGRGIARNDWAAHPITTFPSVQGARFRFTWHPDEQPRSPGHCVMIAPTGAGKTTLLTHLAGQTLRIPNARVWLFDRYSGAEIYTYAMEGDYVRFAAQADEAPIALNPLLLEDSEPNRAFLRTWLLSLISGEKRPEDRHAVERIIRLNFELAAIDHRKLRILARAAFAPRSPGYEALSHWCDDTTAAGRLFNAERDALDTLHQRWTAYDCTEILRDEQLAPVLVHYLMYRIQLDSRQTSNPALVVIDETEPMLKNPDFRDAYRICLQEGRKLRQVFVSCFQNPQAIADLELESLIQATCPTILFAPNPAAKAEHYARYNLTDTEMGFILHGRTEGMRASAEERHRVLVKRYTSKHSAILDVSLAALGPWLRCHDATPDVVNRVRRQRNTTSAREAILEHVGPGAATS